LSIQPAGSVLAPSVSTASVSAASVSAAQTAVLLSALRPPAPSRATVVRKELLDRLLDDASAKLVLVVAPAGWGKTSLLRDWCASGEASATAWLSADGADNDPARFWAGVIAALRTVCPGVGADAQEMRKAPGANAADGVLPSLINDLAGAAGRMTLVIDDFHLIANEEIKQGFGFLVDHLPVTLGLVVATRCDPDLPLARMRARGELAEFRADDLRFSETEAADLLNATLGLALPPDDIHALHERTEGWAAGLYLAALSLRGREDVAKAIPEITGETRQFVDYFAAEVLADQPAEVRSFLLRTSVLNGFCASLCDTVAGPADSDGPAGPAGSDGSAGSQRLLEELERSQLFLVPLDSTRQWYRYHTLFAEWLRHELDRSEPGLAAELHRRASAWHREHGSVSEAIDHAIRAGELADARDLIAAHWQPLLNEGLPETVDAWLDRLPAQMVAEDARMCMIRAWLARFLGRLDEVEPWLAAAKAAAAGLRAGAPASSPGSPSVQVTDMVEPLTSREREVLDLLAEGKSNRGIADQLVVTLDTVKRHVSHILAKLGAVNRTEAVARARGRNLIA
jgi:LuxR family transcriptional regulator, maltose regulon positive regulatory protein